jgi:hypothetical protein
MNCSGTIRINSVGAIFVGLVVVLIVYFNFGQSKESILVTGLRPILGLFA